MNAPKVGQSTNFTEICDNSRNKVVMSPKNSSMSSLLLNVGQGIKTFLFTKIQIHKNSLLPAFKSLRYLSSKEVILRIYTCVSKKGTNLGFIMPNVLHNLSWDLQFREAADRSLNVIKGTPIFYYALLAPFLAILEEESIIIPHPPLAQQTAITLEASS